MTILPAAYLGSVEYFAHLLCDDCVIDLGNILSSVRAQSGANSRFGRRDGPHGARAACQPSPYADAGCAARLFEAVAAPALISLVSAYRGSPYFDHYRSSFEPFYRREYDFLVDYDLELTEVLLQKLNVQNRPRISEQYVEAAPGDLDLRPKQKRTRRFMPSPISRSFPTGCLSRLICQSQTCCLLRVPTRRSY